MDIDGPGLGVARQDQEATLHCPHTGNERMEVGLEVRTWLIAVRLSLFQAIFGRPTYDQYVHVVSHQKVTDGGNKLREMPATVDTVDEVVAERELGPKNTDKIVVYGLHMFPLLGGHDNAILRAGVIRTQATVAHEYRYVAGTAADAAT